MKSFSLSVIMVGWTTVTTGFRQQKKPESDSNKSDSKIIHNIYQRYNNTITLSFLNLLIAHNKNLKVDVSTEGLYLKV